MDDIDIMGYVQIKANLNREYFMKFYDVDKKNINKVMNHVKEEQVDIHYKNDIDHSCILRFKYWHDDDWIYNNLVPFINDCCDLTVIVQPYFFSRLDYRKTFFIT